VTHAVTEMSSTIPYFFVTNLMDAMYTVKSVEVRGGGFYQRPRLKARQNCAILATHRMQRVEFYGGRMNRRCTCVDI